jgi:acyl-CoA synthetase (AMP-forming)/AMP-acid ligase II
MSPSDNDVAGTDGAGRAAALTTWVDAEVRAEFESRGDWTRETWFEYFSASVEVDPTALAVVDETGSLTRGEIMNAARRLAAYMASRDIRPGDVVTLVLPNWREFAVIHAAIGVAGCVVNPVLPQLQTGEIRHIMATTRTRMIFAASRWRNRSPVDQVSEAAASLPDPPEIITVRADSGSDLPALEALLAHPWEVDYPVPMNARDARSWDSITFTSGTEALPKGVVHCHQSTMFGLRAYIGQVLGLTANDCVLMPSPISHASGLQWGLRTAIYIGGPLVLQDRWDPTVALKLIDTYGCTYTLAATPFIVDLIAARLAGVGSGHTLRYLGSGGAPIPRNLVAQVRQELGAELISVFGASETYVTTTTRPGDPERMQITDGVPLPGIEVAIVDEGGEPVEPGTDGEIVTRGPQVFLGYLGDPDLTHRSFRNRWYRFGDLGRFDAEGCLRVTGRIKDIVIRGGENISVREVEDLLAEHPAVERVAVVGYPDARLGERCCAIVLPRDGVAPTLAELADYLRSRGLAAFKLPERLTVVNEMPMTATGKIRKVELRRIVAVEGT